MDGNQPVLHIRAGTHLLRTAEEHMYLPGADFGKEFFLFRLRIRVVDKSYP